MSKRQKSALSRALALLGPLEARIMQVIWTRQVRSPFVVKDVHAEMRELAYTTVMSTLSRLATKGLVRAEAVPGVRAYQYRAALSPKAFLVAESDKAVGAFVDRYGDVAIAAFQSQLDSLSPEQSQRLKGLARR